MTSELFELTRAEAQVADAEWNINHSTVVDFGPLHEAKYAAMQDFHEAFCNYLNWFDSMGYRHARGL